MNTIRVDYIHLHTKSDLFNKIIIDLDQEIIRIEFPTVRQEAY